jgi:radical SAM-linked protein
LFSFSKEGSAVFHGHLSLIEIFSMAINRAGLEVKYTQGFNPLAKLEIVSPLSTGISAGAEIAAVDLPAAISPEEFVNKINPALVEGIKVNAAQTYRIATGQKKHSLSSLLWGFGYSVKDGGTDYIPAKEEKMYRTKRLADDGTVFSLHRASVLAKNVINNDPEQPWASYFDVYGFLYPEEY